MKLKIIFPLASPLLDPTKENNSSACDSTTEIGTPPKVAFPNSASKEKESGEATGATADFSLGTTFSEAAVATVCEVVDGTPDVAPPAYVAKDKSFDTRLDGTTATGVAVFAAARAFFKELFRSCLLCMRARASRYFGHLLKFAG